MKSLRDLRSQESGARISPHTAPKRIHGLFQQKREQDSRFGKDGFYQPAELARSPFLGALFEGFIAAETIKAQSNRGQRPELYYFRDEQGLEVDFLLPRRGGSVALVECRATRTVTPAMAGPMQRLAEALRKKRPREFRVEMSLVHQSPKTPIASQTVAAGVRAWAWADFVRRL